MRLSSVSGFECYSQAIYEFKNHVLGLPIGEKIERVEIPKAILNSENKEVYRAAIRGMFDTNGCVTIVKKDYPMISITITSKKLIDQLKEMFLKLGFIPAAYDKTIYLNGNVMLEKWIKEIGSHNPKNLAQLEKAQRLIK